MHKKGGLKPLWGDEFKIKIDSKSDKLVVRVWDKSTFTNGNSCVGFQVVNIRSLIDEASGEVSEAIKILYDNKDAGTINIKT